MPDPHMTPSHALRPWALSRTTSPAVESARAVLSSVSESARAERAAELYDRLTADGALLIEYGTEDDFGCVTYLWHGDAPRGVYLRANKISDPMDSADTALESLAGTDRHALTLHLPAAYLWTYGFAVPSSPLPPPTLRVAIDQATVAAVRSSTVPDPRARATTVDNAGAAPLAVARGPQAPSLRLGHDDGVPQVSPIQLTAAHPRQRGGTASV